MKTPMPKLAAFRKRYNLTYPLLSDEDQKVFDRFGGGSIPTCVIVDKDGNLVTKIVADLDAVKSELDKLTSYGPAR